MMQQSLSAAPAPVGNRETEHRLFADITAALEALDNATTSTAADALEWNRRLWLTLQTDLSSAGNHMPDDLKAKMISLAVWVDRYTESVLKGEATIEPLVEVNRAIMEGLVSQN